MLEFIFEISLLLLLSFLNPRFRFYWEGGVFVLRGLLNKRGKARWWGVGGSKNVILARRKY